MRLECALLGPRVREDDTSSLVPFFTFVSPANAGAQ